jgi:hypothetical protein
MLRSFLEFGDHVVLKKLRRHWLSLAFVAGFVTDLFLLNKVDDLLDNLILFTYFFLATLSLLLFYFGVAERASARVSAWLVRYMPLLMQYAFGGLLSGMLIFYGRSGDWLVSAPFLLLLVSVIAANEILQKRSDRLIYNIAVYFIGVFSYVVLIVPVWWGDVGSWIFYLSGIIAVLITLALVKLLKFIIPNFVTLQKRLLVFVVGSIYAAMNLLYYLNLIPPIPLSLLEVGVYQSISYDQVTRNYYVDWNQSRWFEQLPFYPQTFYPSEGKGAACFSRVFAPSKLSTEIVHRYEFKNSDGVWQERFRLSYVVSGEALNGYRGYSQITSVSDGKWRCSIENSRGQVLGRQVFTVDTSRLPGRVVTIVK